MIIDESKVEVISYSYVNPAQEVNIDIVWEGKDLNEKGINKLSGETIVEIDAKYFRPSEVEILLGDPSKAERELKWKRNISFQKLVSSMVSYDLKNDSFGGEESF